MTVGTLANRRATLEEFRTTLCIAEATVNSRPLTTVSDDSRDALPITPAHLALGRSLLALPDDLGRDDITTKVAVQWRKRQRLHSEFWGRFRKEYLLALQPSQKWLEPGGAPKVGELVLVDDKPPSRMAWPLAVIEEVLPSGRDGKIRAVVIRFKGGAVSRRDIRYLYRLEENTLKADN